MEYRIVEMKSDVEDWFKDVEEFMIKFRQSPPVNQIMPVVCNEETYKLRMALIAEEVLELRTAWHNKNLAELADAVCDLIYVTIGMAVACGVDIRPVWKAIQEANMTKIPYNEELAEKLRAKGEKVPVGKTLKPPGWTAPDIEEIIQQQIDDWKVLQIETRIVSELQKKE